MDRIGKNIQRTERGTFGGWVRETEPYFRDDIIRWRFTYSLSMFFRVKKYNMCFPCLRTTCNYYVEHGVVELSDVFARD